MSLLGEFTSDLPLTPKKLIQWMKTILNTLDGLSGSGGSDEYVLSGDLYNTLYDTPVWTDVSSIVTASTFMELFRAIQSNKQVRVCKNRTNSPGSFSLVPVYTNAYETPAGTYFKLRMDFFDPSHLTTHQIERVRIDIDYDTTNGEMYLCYKSAHTLDMTA